MNKTEMEKCLRELGVPPKPLLQTRADFPSSFNIGTVRRHLGYSHITVFSQFTIDGWKKPHVEFHVTFTKGYLLDIPWILDELNKRKRFRFWHASVIYLDAEGINTIINAATDRDLKKMKLTLLDQLGAKNYATLVKYVNRRIDKEEMYND